MQQKWIHNISQKSFGRFALMGLLMLGMILHALLPTGFMPSVDNDGKITLVICSGMGEKTIVVDAKDYAPPGGMDHTSSDDGADLAACPYYLAQFSGIYPDTDLLKEPVITSLPQLAIAPLLVLDAQFQAYPPARGPPSLIV